VQEKYRDANPVVGFVIRRFFERLARALGELDPASVLDAGCGEGELLRRGVLPRLSPIPLVCATVEALPFAAQSFDVALCLEVLDGTLRAFLAPLAGRVEIVEAMPWSIAICRP
jgi:2-polyprenyl-3-methyl-5-hydroxy-6-metoxy-1,4-benzoquinol methylase